MRHIMIATNKMTFNCVKRSLIAICLIKTWLSVGPFNVNLLVSSGGLLCCSANCAVNFINCKFDNCQLLVVRGAQVTLTGCDYMHAPLPEKSLTGGVSVYAWGVGTRVCMKGGTITGGLQVRPQL